MKSVKLKMQDYLRNMPLFSKLAEAELDQIAASTFKLQVPGGTTILKQGEECVGFYVVIGGQIRISVASHQGGEKVVEILGAGQSLGEAYMFQGTAYGISAQALADSTLLHIPKVAIFNALEQNPAFMHKILEFLSIRIQALSCDVESQSTLSASQRVINYLLQSDLQNDGDHITLQVSKGTIASSLNLTAEHFSRILTVLAQQGLIRVDGRKVTVIDIAKLRSHENTKLGVRQSAESRAWQKRHVVAGSLPNRYDDRGSSRVDSPAMQYANFLPWR